MAITTVAELVRAARNGRSQKDFAAELGIKQSSISRYECGKANPPVSVIEHCMRLVHASSTAQAPTADELAQRIRTELADPLLDQARLALSRLIEVLIDEHARTRSARATS